MASKHVIAEAKAEWVRDMQEREAPERKPFGGEKTCFVKGLKNGFTLYMSELFEQRTGRRCEESRKVVWRLATEGWDKKSEAEKEECGIKAREVNHQLKYLRGADRVLARMGLKKERHCDVLDIGGPRMQGRDHVLLPHRIAWECAGRGREFQREP